MVNIECFYVTSRRPYWCPKTMNRRPCWCPKPILWELNSFLMQTLSFVPINLHRCRPREWKHSVGKTTATNQWGQGILDRPGSQKSPESNFKKEQWTDPYGRASKRKNIKQENKNKMVYHGSDGNRSVIDKVIRVLSKLHGDYSNTLNLSKIGIFSGSWCLWPCI